MTDWDRTALAVQTTATMAQLTAELSRSYHLLLAGGEFGPCARMPSKIVAEALDMRGGVACPLLYAYCEGHVCAKEVRWLKKLGKIFEKLFALGTEVAQRLQQVGTSGVLYVKRFLFKPKKLFKREFIVGIHSSVVTAEQARARLIARLCTAVRNFWDWLRRAFWALEAEWAPDPMRPIECLAYAQRVVKLADRTSGLFVLQPLSREGSQPFHILPTANQVWNVLRKLCGSTDPDGYVALPSDYAKAFHRTDNNNETIHDDLERLVRHIVPGPRKGHYRLELAEKRPLLRGQ